MADAEGISEALKPLIFQCPDYTDIWRGRRANEFADGMWPPEEFVETAELASWVVDRFAAGDQSCFGELFAVVEELLATGSHDVKELMTIGLLEDIQLGLGDRQTTLDEADDLLKHFGPHTRDAWFMVRSWWNRPKAEW